jgi:hypothetical protein
MAQLQMFAGSLAGLIFAAGSVSMLLKAWRTKDLRSYSPGQMILNNIGNLLYWLYVISLPFGPIYFMHGFFTGVSVLMLIWYFTCQTTPQTAKRTTAQRRNLASMMQADIRQTGTYPAVQVRMGQRDD